jgi:FKBP-type peptidyl-prolyl cis-trans isomerase SlyD
MQVEKDKVVSIHYTLTDDNGKVIDSSQGREPLAYLHGNRNLIIGLENALEGKKVGDKFKVTIPPEEAYGERREELVSKVNRQDFQGVEEILPGMQFHASHNGQEYIVTVTKVEGDEVTIDANHQLAGENLTFEVEVVDIRESTDEERAHGHVHMDGHEH